MSWLLHNSGGGHRPNPILLSPCPVPTERRRWNLCAALGEVAMERCGRLRLDPDKALTPAQVIALLAACREQGPTPSQAAITKAIYRSENSIGHDEAVAALDEAAARRALSGALLVREIPADAAKQNQPFSPKGVSVDLEMTLLILSKSATRIFLATKRPVLERLRLNITIETIALDLFQEKNP